MGLDLYTIEWKPNPLLSVVRLTEVGRIRLQLARATELLTDARVSMILGKREQDCEKWWSYCTLSRIPGEEMEDTYAWLDRETAKMEEWLVSEHCGDCICEPASCGKCHAESLLGIDTIAGLGTHEANKIGTHEFSSVAAVIEHLQRPIKPTWGTPDDWAPYMSRWEQERANAIAWMTAYGKEHNL